MISINPAVSLFPMSHRFHHLFPFPLYFQAGRSAGVPRHLARWMSGERLPGWMLPWPAATSPKVLPSLIPLPDLRGLGG